MSIIKSRWVIGFIIILLGFTLLLNNLNITNVDLTRIFLDFWPVLLILGGLTVLFDKGSKGEFFTGMFILFIGIIFLGKNLELFYFNLSSFWGLFWPSILILTGLSFLFGPISPNKSYIAFMGGIEKKKKSWCFESGSYIAFMGGIELDLSIAEISDGEHFLDLTAVMGGIEITVPKDVEIHCQGIVFLGGLDLLDRSTGGIVSSSKSIQYGQLNNKKIIKILTRALMGGISIKN